MAIEVLHGNVNHTWRHDLESFFWLFLWICATKEKKPYSGIWPDPIQPWTQTPESARVQKWAQVTNKGDFNELLDLFHGMFHNSVKKLAQEIKKVLFPLRVDTSEGEIRYIYLEDTERDAGYDKVIAAFDTCLEDKDLDQKVEGRRVEGC